MSSKVDGLSSLLVSRLKHAKVLKGSPFLDSYQDARDFLARRQPRGLKMAKPMPSAKGTLLIPLPEVFIATRWIQGCRSLGKLVICSDHLTCVYEDQIAKHSFLQFRFARPR